LKKSSGGVRVVFITASSAAEARKISDALLKEKLAACVNVTAAVTSRYWWKGKIDTAKERLLIAKTTQAKVPALIRRVKEIHSYDVPEIIALPVLAGNPDYLAWVGDSVR
jgi:periplasmic divalent cation tolerance protein